MRIAELKAEWISSERAPEWLAHEYIPILDTERPVFSWRMDNTERNTVQKSFRINVFHSDGEKARDDWDSGLLYTEDQSIEYAGKALLSFTEYTVLLQVWDNHGFTAQKTMCFETGRMNDTIWRGVFLIPEQKEAVPDEKWAQDLEKDPDNSRNLTPAVYLRKELTVGRKVKRARLYATAHGVYQAVLDGRRVGDIELAPGFTSYDSFLEYQAYDLTDRLTAGSHVLGIVLADGWYLGHIGVTGMNCQYGTKKAFFCEIHIEYEDGSAEVVTGQEGFFSRTGAIVYSDIFVGERYDARLEESDWMTPGDLPEGWSAAADCLPAETGMRASYGEPVRCKQVLKPKQIIRSQKNELLIDFGQVLAGKAKIVFRNTRPGQEIVLRHTEVLDAEGCYYHNIMGQFKDQRDAYVCRGAEEEEYTPYFTFHGFRYIKIEGYEADTLQEDAKALVMYSDMEDTGSFSCSDERLDQLFHNILWSQYGNMLSIPTDCPQRERAGWTGDAQIFCETAALNMDISAFMKRWLYNIRLDQKTDGQIPVVVPYHKSYHPETIGIDGKDSAAGWGDVITFLPWRMYQATGDRRWLTDNYDAMKKWVEYVRKEAEDGIPEKYIDAPEEVRERQHYLWNTGFNFGDWLVPSLSSPDAEGQTDAFGCAARTKDEISTAYFAKTTDLLEQIAGILGKEDDRKQYKELAEKIRRAFAEEYVTDDGKLISDMQGNYVIALAFDMIRGEARRTAAERLFELIHANGDCLDTGFLSVDLLLDVLCKEGRSDLAYTILFQEKAPSWLYEVKMGATTIWEAWKAILPDGTPSGCSFNHYAFGCVGRFLYQRIGGLKISEPGYREFVVEPDFSCRLDHAEVSHRSPYGRIAVRWEKQDGRYRVSAEIPAGTHARIILPGMEERVGSGNYCYTLGGIE